METRGPEGRGRRLLSIFKRRETPLLATSLSSSLDNQATQPVNNVYDDRQLALNRYGEATTHLKEAIKIRKGPWSAFIFDELSDEPGALDDLQFKNKINAILLSQESLIKDKKGWSKFTDAVECVFTALSPLVKNFLSVVRDAQSVI